MPLYLTWNVYHGNIVGPPATTVQQRIANIVGVGIANNVDVICLQEVPQA